MKERKNSMGFTKDIIEKNQGLTAEKFGEDLAPELRKRGFNKRKLNWFKEEKDLTILFYIQKSMWGKEIWYYHYGVSINALHEKKGYTLGYFDISTRFDQIYRRDILDDCLKESAIKLFGNRDRFVLSPTDILLIMDMWIKEYGSIKKLQTKDDFPFETHINAIEYLKKQQFRSDSIDL